MPDFQPSTRDGNSPTVHDSVQNGNRPNPRTCNETLPHTELNLCNVDLITENLIEIYLIFNTEVA